MYDALKRHWPEYLIEAVMLVRVGSGVYAGHHIARVANREGEGQAPAMEPIVTPFQSVYPAQVAVG